MRNPQNANVHSQIVLYKKAISLVTSLTKCRKVLNVGERVKWRTYRFSFLFFFFCHRVTLCSIFWNVFWNESKHYKGSPIEFFNPVIPTQNLVQSLGYVWHPTPRAYFQSRTSPRFRCIILNPEPQIREIPDPDPQIRESLDLKPQIWEISDPEPQRRKISDPDPQIREISNPKPQRGEIDPEPQMREFLDPEPQIKEIRDPEKPVGDLHYKPIFLLNFCFSQLEYQRQQLLAERQQFHQEQLKAAEMRVRAAAGHLSPSASSPGHLQPQPQVSQPQPQFPQQRQPQQHRPSQQAQPQVSQAVVAGHNVPQAPSPSPQGKDSGKLSTYSFLTRSLS